MRGWNLCVTLLYWTEYGALRSEQRLEGALSTPRLPFSCDVAWSVECLPSMPSKKLVILALGRWGQEDQESKASLCYTEFKTSLTYMRSQLNKKGSLDKPQAVSLLSRLRQFMIFTTPPLPVPVSYLFLQKGTLWGKRAWMAMGTPSLLATDCSCLGFILEPA